MADNITVDQATGELTVASTPDGLVLDVQNIGKSSAGEYSSLSAETFEDKLALVTAVQSSEPVDPTILNKKINWRHIIVQTPEMLNEQTKEMERTPRMVFVADDGKAYHAFGAPLFRDVRQVLSILGEPQTWPGALPATIKKEGTGSRKYFTLKIG